MGEGMMSRARRSSAGGIEMLECWNSMIGVMSSE